MNYYPEDLNENAHMNNYSNSRSLNRERRMPKASRKVVPINNSYGNQTESNTNRRNARTNASEETESNMREVRKNAQKMSNRNKRGMSSRKTVPVNFSQNNSAENEVNLNQGVRTKRSPGIFNFIKDMMKPVRRGKVVPVSSNESSENESSLTSGGTRKKKRVSLNLKEKTVVQLRRLMKKHGKKCSKDGKPLKKSSMIRILAKCM